MRILCVAAAMVLSPGHAFSQATKPVASLPRASFDTLYEQITLAKGDEARKAERRYADAGGVVLTGTVGKVMPGNDGAAFVWLKYTGSHPVPADVKRTDRVVGRFLIRPQYAGKVGELSMGSRVTMACAGPTYSGWLLASECEILD